MEQYTNLGGRVFASHYHYYWFKSGSPAFSSIASWTSLSVPDTATIYDIDMSFPKGKAFGQWLKNTGASTTLGQIPLDVVRDDVTTINTKTTTRWVHRTTPAESVKYLSFATPIGKPAETQCGRAVFSDIHISARSVVSSGTFPTSCTPGSFSPQEKALEFLFFDLSSCVQPDGEPPKVPPVK